MIKKKKSSMKNLMFNGYTGEQVNYVKNYCSKCGHSMTFLSNANKICQYCGTLVYPTKEIEFKNKLMKEILRHE